MPFVARGIISLALLLTFLIVTFTGVGLLFAPKGRFHYWTFFGISKENLKLYHRISSIIFVALALVHFGINFKVLIAELRALKK